MKKKVSRFRLGAGLSLLGVAVFLASTSGGVAAQTSQARMFVEAPTEQVKKGGADFQVNVVADNVTNLAGFQFSLAYDPSVIKYVSVEGGSFLGSTGREPQCLDPKVNSGNPEVLQFNCVTLGPPISVQGAKAGADGSGVLATVTFSPIGNGLTGLDLQDGRMVAAELNSKGMPLEISTAVENSTLTVASSGGGIPWMVLGPAVGVIAAAVIVGLVLFVRMRTRRSVALGMK